MHNIILKFRFSVGKENVDWSWNILEILQYPPILDGKSVRNMPNAYQGKEQFSKNILCLGRNEYERIEKER